MKLKETILRHKVCLLLLSKVPFCLVKETGSRTELSPNLMSPDLILKPDLIDFSHRTVSLPKLRRQLLSFQVCENPQTCQTLKMVLMSLRVMRWKEEIVNFTGV